MTPDIAYVLVLLLLGLGLFSSDWLRVDVVSLILLLLLTIPGTLTPSEALAGFGSETILVLITLFVLTEGVIKTGVVERLGIRLASLGGSRPLLFTRCLIASVMVVSSFVSNTVTTAVFLPIVVGAAARAHMPASRLLMPLAFASILSGSVTLIGTSTNLVVSGQLPRLGLEPLGFFEMAPVGLAISIVGLAYLLFVAPRRIPNREVEEAPQDTASRKYVSEVVLTKRSPLLGKTLKDIRLADVVNLLVVGVRRSARRILDPFHGDELREGDEILIEGSAQDILSVKDVAGIDLRSEVKLAEAADVREPTRMVEAMVMPQSPLVGQTLGGTSFHQATGLTVLALHAVGQRRSARNLSRSRLKPSDVLLLQGTPEALARLKPDDLLVLEDLSAHHPRSPKGPWAAAIFVGALVLGATGIVALPIAFLIGVLAMVLTRCLSAEEAYASVDWRLLVLIGSMMAFGAAVVKTGASGWIAALVVEHVSSLGPIVVMGAFYLLTVILSQPMSNQAAALIVLPVAVETARTLGLDPRTFVIAVTLAASCSFLTPLEPACLLVYNAGRYKFFDFFRVGAPLTLLVFVITMLLVPVFWPFTPSG